MNVKKIEFYRVVESVKKVFNLNSCLVFLFRGENNDLWIYKSKYKKTS